MEWKVIKKFALRPGYDTNYLDFELSPPEQLRLERFIKTEQKYPNFLTEMDPKDVPRDEVLVFAYYAGHGCADHRQYYLLNENTVERIFWPV